MPVGYRLHGLVEPLHRDVICHSSSTVGHIVTDTCFGTRRCFFSATTNHRACAIWSSPVEAYGSKGTPTTQSATEVLWGRTTHWPTLFGEQFEIPSER